MSSYVDFNSLFEIPLRNGVTKPKKVRGNGHKMVNMGELFAYSIIKDIEMDRVPLTETEKKNSLIKQGDLLFARQSLVRSGAGQCSIFLGNQNDVCFESHLIRCRLNKEIANPLFYFYFFKSSIGRNIMDTIVEQGAGASGIRGSDLSNLKVLYLDLKLQNQIAEQLYTLDEKIELNNETNQTLEQIAQTIFKSWFVDFDPVKAKAQAISDGLTETEVIEQAMAVISGKSSAELHRLQAENPEQYQQLFDIAKAFPSEMEDVEGFGEVPKGWGVKALSDLGKIICGKTPSKSKPENYGDDIPFIKIPDMHNNVFITKTSDNLSEVGANSQKNKYIPKGSICVSCIATVGLVSLSSCLSQTNQQINTIVPNDTICSEYIYLYLSQPEMRKVMIDLASGGSATLNMNTTTFSKIEIMKPSDEVVELFWKKVSDIFNMIYQNGLENIKLAEIRDELLPKLLSGEINV